jgi:hypothetical protein
MRAAIVGLENFTHIIAGSIEVLFLVMTGALPVDRLGDALHATGTAGKYDWRRFTGRVFEPRSGCRGGTSQDRTASAHGRTA